MHITVYIITSGGIHTKVIEVKESLIPDKNSSSIIFIMASRFNKKSYQHKLHKHSQ